MASSNQKKHVSSHGSGESLKGVLNDKEQREIRNVLLKITRPECFGQFVYDHKCLETCEHKADCKKRRTDINWLRKASYKIKVYERKIVYWKRRIEILRARGVSINEEGI